MKAQAEGMDFVCNLALLENNSGEKLNGLIKISHIKELMYQGIRQ